MKMVLLATGNPLKRAKTYRTTAVQNGGDCKNDSSNSIFVFIYFMYCLKLRFRINT